jgi:hypothetical protein
MEFGTSSGNKTHFLLTNLLDLRPLQNSHLNYENLQMFVNSAASNGHVYKTLSPPINFTQHVIDTI